MRLKKEMHPLLIEKLAGYVQFILVFTSTLALACPSDCSCKWKGGKQSVECLNCGLDTFPSPMDPRTQVLDLAGNSFETLPPDHFMRLGLINLQKIFLAKCRLSHVSPRTFRGLSNLVDLDLSNNVLREVPSGAFPDCQGLMRLVLTANPITRLQRNAFISLESLTTLEISDAVIELVEKGAFDGLLSLGWLKLNGNKLKYISGLSSLPLGLKGIWLEDNPWECDCHLLELRLWLTERNVANSVDPRCLTPSRLTNTSLKDLTTDNFACVPQLSPTTMYQKIGEGKNVSLLCKVISVPEATIEWWFNGQPVSNASMNMLVESSTSIHASSFPLPVFADNNNPYPPLAEMSSGSVVGGGTPSIHNSNNNYETLAYTSSVIGIERKSELLIFNATGEENGTFVCVAKNSAGIGTANFTLKVLIRSDAETYLEHSVTSLVASYPNIIVIVVSTVSAVGAVIIVFILTFIICKCSRLCRKNHCSRSASSNQHSKAGTNHHHFPRSFEDSKDSGSYRGRLSRHLSEASNLTSTTKSNGSIYLLSSSSELGIADSNPDLIEGVKRVEGDGQEIIFSSSSFPNTRAVYAPQESSSAVSPATLEPFHPSMAYPMDYGLPAKTYNCGTLIRRSQSNQTNQINLSTTMQPQMMSIPENYDLAKYPKEYINPPPLSSCTPQQVYSSQISLSLPPLYPSLNQGGIGTANICAGHIQHHHQSSANQYYSGTYMVAPSGTLLSFNSSSSEDYYISMAMGHLHGGMIGPGGNDPPSMILKNMIQLNPGGTNCTCTTIPEQSEEEEKAATLEAQKETESIMMSTGKNDIHLPNLKAITQDSMIDAQDKSSIRSTTDQIISTDNFLPSPSSHSKKHSSNGGGVTTEMGIVARLQRKLKAQTNESPDEGYEDESAEGTEI